MNMLLDRSAKVTRIVTINSEQARAIGDPARAEIVSMLYHKPLSPKQIADELAKSGYEKAISTTRHHINILIESGLIELVRLDDSSGAVTKYYGTSIKLLGFEVPGDFDSKHSKIIDKTSAKITKIVDWLLSETQQLDTSPPDTSPPDTSPPDTSPPDTSPPDTSPPDTSPPGDKDPKEYSQYLVAEIINRAMTNLLENSTDTK